MKARLGVCSWSLRPVSPEDLCERVRLAGFDAVQLALDPVRTGWGEARTAGALERAGLRLLSGMMAMESEDYSTLETIRRTGGVRPDQTWEANRATAAANAALARRLGIGLVTFHAGFLPHESSDPERERMIERLRELRDTFADQGVRIALETGQEGADTLLSILAELAGIGVNFDPANIVLYGMGDPIEAFRRLAPRVAQIHIKDARPASTAGEWGRETPVGEGSVDWSEFLSVYKSSGLGCDLIVEREGGEDRGADVARAATTIRGLMRELEAAR